MDIRKLWHPGWGLVLTILLAIAGTFSPHVVRGILLFAAVVTGTATFYKTEFAAKSVPKTVGACLVFVMVAAGIYFVALAIEYTQKSRLAQTELASPPKMPPVASTVIPKAKGNAFFPNAHIPERAKTTTRSVQGPPQSPTAIAPNGIANAAPNFGNQTVNNGPPPPAFTLTKINENVSTSDGLYQSDYRLDVRTKSIIPSLFVRAEAPSIASGNRNCLQVLAIHEGYSSGEEHDSVSRSGFCETHVENVASGVLQITLLSTKPEQFVLTYKPD
jgi:hypothetical protein